MIELPRGIGAALAFVFRGLMFGSFVNVVAYRLPRDISIVRPRSFCPLQPSDSAPGSISRFLPTSACAAAASSARGGDSVSLLSDRIGAGGHRPTIYT